MKNKYICVTIGDINGIGIKLLINLWKEKRIKKFVLLTNYNLFKRFLKTNKINIKIKIFKLNKKLNYDNYFLIYDIKSKNNIDNTYNSLKYSYNLVKKNIFSGIINLPLNKEKIIDKINKKFIGQTEFYKNLENKKDGNMIFYSNKIITSTLTTHIPLNHINKFLKKNNLIYQKIKSLNLSLINDFNIKKPKIIFLGINPHAGENGKIGKEDLMVNKILKKLYNENIKIYGPVSADSVFTDKNIKFYNCFLSMYHDQALIPFKILSKFNGVNYTGSLDIIRVSPIHGTGYDLIDTPKKANYNSLLYCFKIINKIIKNRNKID